MNETHRPSGSMCQVCNNKGKGLNLNWNCPNHDKFKTMKPIKTDKDGVIVVKCEGFEHEDRN